MSRRKVTMGFACSMHLVLASRAFSLPIGFGYNQGNLQFSEIVTNDFLIYYDQRTPMDGIVAANALKAAKPHLDRWFQIKRKSPLIVNMSAESENASFANFVTDSIELQTLGQGSRDLAWHEYTHAMMYQHLDNIFGPAGALIHLPWMEAWFLEGLAEAVSVSVGSEQQAGIERYQALQNDWPSWDRIHSLYTSGPFSYRGYATSGAFVAWILRTYDAGKLAESLQTFRSDTMPWWWPWALTPFNDFWPMDTMLTKWTGLGGRELYENYKMAATQHWRGLKLPPVMTKMTEPHLKIPSPQNLTSLRGQLHSLKLEDGNYYLKNVMLKEPSVTATTLGDVTQLIASESDLASSAIAVDIDTVLYASNHWPRSRQRRASLMLRVKERTRTLKRRATGIQKTWLSKTNAWWIESELETTRVCKVPRNNFKKSSVTCGLAAKTPSTLNFLGSKDESGSTRASEIWVALTTQTVGGDRHQVIHLDAESGTQKVFPIEFGGRPHSLAFTPEGLWILVSDRSMRHLRRFDQSGKCLESLTPSDFPSRILNSELSRPWIVNWMGGDFSVSSPNRNTLASRACFGVDDHISPLLAALRSKDNLSFQEATRRASIWTITPVTNTALEITGLGRKSIDKADEARSLSVDTTYASPLDLASSADGISPSPQTKGSDYHWRGRPIFAFPWVGADDALGPQIGMVSVPLMDHMQNETVRATALLGL
ncbi:MAG: hypothetical protein NTV34_13705, partial [Proteobacteria bacterium]|nr:hypothetical protein [Pseudomonadota bacterium]